MNVSFLFDHSYLDVDCDRYDVQETKEGIGEINLGFTAKQERPDIEEFGVLIKRVIFNENDDMLYDVVVLRVTNMDKQIRITYKRC